MWILVAEAMLAVALLLLIVWWTLGPTQRREREELRRLARDSVPDAGESRADASTDATDPRAATSVRVSSAADPSRQRRDG